MYRCVNIAQQPTVMSTKTDSLSPHERSAVQQIDSNWPETKHSDNISSNCSVNGTESSPAMYRENEKMQS